MYNRAQSKFRIVDRLLTLTFHFPPSIPGSQVPITARESPVTATCSLNGESCQLITKIKTENTHLFRPASKNASKAQLPDNAGMSAFRASIWAGDIVPSLGLETGNPSFCACSNIFTGLLTISESSFTKAFFIAVDMMGSYESSSGVGWDDPEKIERKDEDLLEDDGTGEPGSSDFKRSE